MSSWETILDYFPSEDQLELTEEEQAYSICRTCEYPEAHTGSEAGIVPSDDE